jgi:FlaA1/EpsC-like NDP-sugar epimerase
MTIDRFTRRTKQLFVVALDVFLVTLSIWLAISLRLDEWGPPKAPHWYAYAFSVAVTIPIFARFGLYRWIFRYADLAAINEIAKALLTVVVFIFPFFVWFAPTGVPRSTGLIAPIVLFMLVATSRMAAKHALSKGGQVILMRRVLIYGAGHSGTHYASALSRNPSYSVAGFVDDNVNKTGQLINGLPVYPFAKLRTVVDRYKVTDVLLALPPSAAERRAEVIGVLRGMHVHVLTIPKLEAIIEGGASLEGSELDVNDLLGRVPVAPDRSLLSKLQHNKVVLVTGAGGSIGGELCRQIIKEGCRKLVMVEQSEFALYAIHQEIIGLSKTSANRPVIVPILADVKHAARIGRIFEVHDINTVYHAAAYKHVPLVEWNAVEGASNNIVGTTQVAIAAKNAGVRNFVLISTDKAVRPTNVMGATKRVAEMVLQDLARDESQGGRGTRFTIVRFGNVLGSSGSVVPLFRKQIDSGGPVTVTDERVTRYFMTIPEAAQLVMQAGAMGSGGDVFLLDMGSPVKIVDLARRMIHLAGKEIKDANNSDSGIAIVFSGLRDGEKLYEELLIGDNPQPTNHPKIMRATEVCLTREEMAHTMEELFAILKQDDDKSLKLLLSRVVHGYEAFQPVSANDPVHERGN